MTAPQPVLTTTRLRLRTFTMADAPPLHAIFSDPKVMEYFGNPHPDLATTERFVRGTIADTPATACDFIVERDGQVIGKAGMWQMGEIGFLLHRDHQRQGLMTEALTAILPLLFDRYPIDAITADVDPRNAASLGILGALGFKRTGTAAATIQVGGEWCDSVYLALGRDALPEA